MSHLVLRCENQYDESRLKVALRYVTLRYVTLSAQCESLDTQLTVNIKDTALTQTASFDLDHDTDTGIGIISIPAPTSASASICEPGFTLSLTLTLTLVHDEITVYCACEHKPDHRCFKNEAISRKY